MGYYRFGNKNPRWKGGTSAGYQMRIYEDILRRNGVDLNVCQICGINKKDTKRMCVHHIDWDHKNNNFNNLTRLCTKCHSKIHQTKKKIGIICKFCQNPFYVVPSIEDKRKFCSQTCSNRYYNERRKGINDHKFKDCVVCGKTFSFPPSRLKKGDPKFCSQKCYYEFRKKDKNAMKKWNKRMLELNKTKGVI